MKIVTELIIWKYSGRLVISTVRATHSPDRAIIFVGYAVGRVGTSALESSMWQSTSSVFEAATKHHMMHNMFKGDQPNMSSPKVPSLSLLTNRVMTWFRTVRLFAAQFPVVKEMKIGSSAEASRASLTFETLEMTWDDPHAQAPWNQPPWDIDVKCQDPKVQ